MVRPARVEEVPLIATLIRELAEYEKLAHEAVLTEAQLAEHLFGARPAAEVVMVEDAGEVVGFALFFQSFSTFLAQPGLYLEDLFIRPHARRRGHGRAVFVHLAQLTVSRGYGRLEWSVLDWNALALGFYRQLGAVGMSEWTVHRLTGSALRVLAGADPV